MLRATTPMQMTARLVLVALPALLGLSCVHEVSPKTQAQAASPPFGFSRPVVVQAVSFRWRWVAACFAQSDSNADGSIEIFAGRHGRMLGDEVFPYLLTKNALPERIARLLEVSADHRFIAFLKDDAVWLQDAATRQRWNLSALGARSSFGDDDVLGQELLAFSSRGQLAFVGRLAEGYEVKVMDLISGDVESVYTTTNRVWRLSFTDSGKRVRVVELPASPNEAPIHTTRASGPCTRAGTQTVFQTQAKTREVYARVDLDDREELPQEHVVMPDHVCTPAGQVPLASSSTGEHLVSAKRTRAGARFESGPLRWVKAPLEPDFCASPPFVESKE